MNGEAVKKWTYGAFYWSQLIFSSWIKKKRKTFGVGIKGNPRKKWSHLKSSELNCIGMNINFRCWPSKGNRRQKCGWFAATRQWSRWIIAPQKSNILWDRFRNGFSLSRSRLIFYLPLASPSWYSSLVDWNAWTQT